MSDAHNKTDSQWRSVLQADLYHIAREKGTEPAFSGKYHSYKQAGVYQCACCHASLFDARHKYNSNSGWPSYWQPIDPSAVHQHADQSRGMVRTEVCCANCKAHLGHVFDDGPQPTGLRFCINSISLEFVEA